MAMSGGGSFRFTKYVASHQKFVYSLSHDTLTTHYEDTTMLQQFNSQFIAASKQLSDTLFKAHTLALEGFERITDLNLKALDGRVQATTEFFTTATESNDVEGFKNAFPKGVNLIKEHSEKLYNNSQEVLGVTLKTTEALTQLAKGAFESANETVTKQVNTVTKQVNDAAKKAAK